MTASGESFPAIVLINILQFRMLVVHKEMTKKYLVLVKAACPVATGNYVTFNRGGFSLFQILHIKREILLILISQLMKFPELHKFE